MSLLREIQEAAVDGSSDLETLLRKCRVLATRLKHEELKNWVTRELDGYPNEVELPEYRMVRGMPYGNFMGAYGRGVNNVPVPETAFPENMRHIMTHRYFREGVGALKTLVDSVEGPSLRCGWPAEAAAILRTDNMAPDMVLAQGWVFIDKSRVVGILSTVRNKILNFALEIEDVYPDAGENKPGQPPVPKDVVNHIYNQTFHGPVANVATGQGIAQTGTINIQQGDFRTLATFLEEQGLGKEDIKDLEVAIKEDPHPTGRKFGKKVAAWMGKMVSKAATGAWKVGTDVAAKVLTKALEQHYGLPPAP